MIAIAVLGLLLPGYLLARALRVPAAWAAAFPLSVFLLAETVIAYTLLGIPIRFGYVLASIVVLSLVCLAACLRRKTEPAPVFQQAVSPPFDNSVKALYVVVGVQVVLVLAGMLVRTTLFPLSGSDTAFRWEGLAKLMLEQGSLEHYPPVTAEDYCKYTYPDGIPPLTSTVYWWLYAAWGDPCPAITSLAVVLQAASCFSLVYCAACVICGPVAGLVALGVLSSSTFLLTGIAIGQETGYTAICYAGQLLFAFAAIRKPQANTVLVAGMFAGLGGLARDYGPFLSLCGFVVLVCHCETRRYVPLFCLTAVGCFGAWYVRNWALTGNPLYPMAGLGFPTNPVHTGLIAFYRARVMPDLTSVALWIHAAKMLLMGATLALLVGVPGIVAMGRKGIAIGISVAAVFCLWILSIRYTTGGFDYSMRVLTPAWVALSVAAGVLGRLWVGPNDRQKKLLSVEAVLILLCCGGYAVLACWSHPLAPGRICEAIASTRKDPLDRHSGAVPFVTELEESTQPATGILTSDFYFATALRRYTRFRPVMLRSPEVAFVFDHSLDATEVRRRLIAQNIRLVMINNFKTVGGFVQQYPFYRDDQANWQLLQTSITDGYERKLFRLPPPTPPAEESTSPP